MGTGKNVVVLCSLAISRMVWRIRSRWSHRFCFSAGAGSMSGHLSCCGTGSGDFDFDLLWLGLLVLGQMHSQDAVLELGTDLAGTGIIRKRERAPETAVGTFHAVILLIRALGQSFVYASVMPGFRIRKGIAVVLH